MESHFVFNDKVYYQEHGVAMGSLLEFLLADIYLNDLKSKLKHILEENGVIYWKRFVDDCSVLIRKDADVSRLLDILNNFDSATQFTFEEE